MHRANNDAQCLLGQVDRRKAAAVTTEIGASFLGIAKGEPSE